MLRRWPRGWLLAAPLVYLLYFHGLSAAGLLGPDEPRYASIGREMARSGDWITPRLWGEPWFEKPALIYWMTAAAFRSGLGEDLAPRLPVALLSVAFLVLFQRLLSREFGPRPAWYATVMLGTTAGWIGYSQIGVADLPMSAAFALSMLLALPWLKEGDARKLPLAAAALGLAVLAKGLVPIVLAVPLLWTGRKRLPDLLRARVILPFLAVAAPWYGLCYARNGAVFLRTFFWEHHLGRYTTGALQHVQPFWFYAPVLLGALLPWTPALFLAIRKQGYQDPRRRFLLLWLAFGFVFFSVAANKLPGYILPLLPAAAALAGLGLAEAGRVRLALTASGVCLMAFPIARAVLPVAVADGLSRAPLPEWNWAWLLPPGVAAAVWWLDRSGRRDLALGTLGIAAAASAVYLKAATFPELDRMVSARPLWSEVRSQADRVCVADLRRSWRYGLNYYSVVPLPDCTAEARPLRVVQDPGQPPSLAAAGEVRPDSPDAPRLDPS